jgi:hypothetical protein
MFQKLTVCQGMTLVVPKDIRKMPGFSPCGTEADPRHTIFETSSSQKPPLAALETPHELENCSKNCSKAVKMFIT